MISTIQMAGLIGFIALVVAVIVLATISTVKNRKRPRPADNNSGGSLGRPDDTPGDWGGPGD